MAHALDIRSGLGIKNVSLVVLLIWFLLALAGSLQGWFDSEPRPPIPLGLATVLPVAFFVFVYLASITFRQFVLSLDLRMLTLAQAWRVGGGVFIILYLRGLLPGVFALPAGWGDMAIGVTAPLIAWSWKQPFPRKLFLLWNVLGSLDLVLAVTLGVLASATPIGVLAADVTTRLMGQFPLSLIPTFFVPLLLIFHLICLISVDKSREQTASGQRHAACHLGSPCTV